MARQKRTSRAIEKAEGRIASLKSIDPLLDLGGDLTVANYQTQIDETQQKLDSYNTLLSQLDAALNNLQADEKALNTLSARMLSGVGSRYGKDSNEYEMAGGTRPSETRRTAQTPS